MQYDRAFEQELAAQYTGQIAQAQDSSAVRAVAEAIIRDCDANQGEDVSFIPMGLTYALFGRMGEVTGIQLREQEYGNPTNFALTMMHLVGLRTLTELFADSSVFRGGRGEPQWHKRLVAIRTAANWESLKG